MVPPLKDDNDDAFLPVPSEEGGPTAEKNLNRSSSSNKDTTAAAPTTTTTSTTPVDHSTANTDNSISFSHVQLYVDSVESLETYKTLEGQLNMLSLTVEENHNSIEEKRMEWQKIVGGGTTTQDITTTTTATPSPQFVPQKRDIIKQLLVGFGMRVTGYHRSTTGTTSFLLTTRDPSGIQMVVTAPVDNNNTASVIENDVTDVDGLDPHVDDEGSDDDDDDDVLHHFESTNLDQFFQCHHGRQGVAVLSFHVKDVGLIHERYQELHPNLIHCFHTYNGEETKILEVYAYYERSETTVDHQHRPDVGTIIRFIETEMKNPQRDSTASDYCLLPGLTRIDAQFDSTSSPCYFDHWVSNVHSRTQFLSTLHETLGFDAKVDFNAGVVAAGEAQIESTVTGNDSTLRTNDKAVALKDQTQVYLPINNALSPVGHVHGFLQEIGQGIQHIANRVENLVEFISRCNMYREITGEGFTTLKIPRSYYGILTQEHLIDSARISPALSQNIMNVCADLNIMSSDGAVGLDISAETLVKHLDDATIHKDLKDEYMMQKNEVIGAILNSRYGNLQKLLGHHITEESYMGIVRNQILCDVQGDDVLFQIFTCNILQNNPGEEAPFLEFIQRVCSECQSTENGCPKPIKPGCGGFGIRNFLTLFLSIEVSKAMMDVSDARIKGDARRQEYAQKRVNAFTDQLNESNPILTRISDAMTEEGRCLMRIKQSQEDNDVHQWIERLDKSRKEKEEGNQALMACSERYQKYMRGLREQMEHNEND